MEFRPISELVREIHIRDAREEGMEKGRIDMAKNMLTEGFASAVVAKVSGLPVEEIERLRP
jgi:hypothetical protein